MEGRMGWMEYQVHAGWAQARHTRAFALDQVQRMWTYVDAVLYCPDDDDGDDDHDDMCVCARAHRASRTLSLRLEPRAREDANATRMA